jgi:hypothetical protein
MDNKPNFLRLRIIQIAALITGAIVFAVSLLLMGQFRKP